MQLIFAILLAACSVESLLLKCRCRQVSRLRRDINYDYNPYDDLKFGSLLNGTEDPTNPFLDYGSYTTKENSDSTSESIQQYDYLPPNTDYPDQYKSKVKEPTTEGHYMKPATPSNRNYIRDDKNPFPMKNRFEYWDPCCGQYLNRSINYTSNELLCFKHLDVSEHYSFINSVNALACFTDCMAEERHLQFKNFDHPDMQLVEDLGLLDKVIQEFDRFFGQAKWRDEMIKNNFERCLTQTIIDARPLARNVACNTNALGMLLCLEKVVQLKCPGQDSNRIECELSRSDLKLATNIFTML